MYTKISREYNKVAMSQKFSATQNFESIKAIFFDSADTLYTQPEIENEHNRYLHLLIAEKHNIHPDEAKVKLKDITHQLKSIEKHVTKVRSMAEFGFTKDQVYEAFAKVDHTSMLKEDPELRTMILTLSKKYKLGIISNYTKVLMSRILKGLGLSEGLFPLMVAADMVKDIKPAHEPFLKAVELSKANPDECLFIGDSPTKDMLPAKEVGMKTILIRQNPSEEDLKNADAYIANVKLLPSILHF